MNRSAQQSIIAGLRARPRRAFLRDMARLGVGLLGLGLLGGCVPAPPAAAPGSARIYRVGLLSLNSESGEVGEAPFGLLIARLGELGYTEGQNLVIERRDATAIGTADTASRLAAAAELVALRVDVLVIRGGAVRAAKAATSTIPIVMLGQVDDPVASGVVESLARPGGNVTGVGGLPPEVDLKRLQLLTEAVPGISRVAVLGNPGDREFWGPAERALGVEAFGVPLAPEGWESTVAHAAEQGADAILARNVNQALIGALTARYRLPAISSSRSFVEAGGLMAYEARGSDIQRRGADYVDRLLRGANPAELPVELPTRYDLIVNMRTARALGITFPTAFLAQVDEIIE